MSTQVDFYLLAESSRHARDLFVCRLVEKAHRLGHAILLLISDQPQRAKLDALLWSFRAESFLPHGEQMADEGQRIFLDDRIRLDRCDDLLINLTDALPGGFVGFNRVAEIVTSDPLQRELSRQRFRAYRQAGIQPVTHDLTGETRPQPR